MRKTLAIIFIIININIVIGQNFVPSNTTSFKFTPQNLGLTSPQSADFIRYGNLEMNLYNGLVDVDIPIYSYKDNDFDISLYAKYVSKLFKPSERPSIIGHNWMLHAGGVITREVVGAPDDTKGKNTNSIRSEYQPDGILAAISNGNFKIYDENTFINLQMDRGNGGYGGEVGRKDFKHDFGPDIFKFSFGEYAGSFIIGNNGTPVLLEGKDFKIDISQLTVQEHKTDNSIPKSSTIKITTPDGMIFEFGGNEYYFEYYIPKKHTNNKHNIISKPRFISAWHLKSVTAPNGRKIEYTYSRNQHKNRYTYHVYNSDYYSISSRITSPFEYIQDLFPPENNTPPFPAKKFEMADEIHIPILKEINIDNTIKVNFQTKKISDSFYPNETDDLLMCLDKISVTYASGFENKEIHSSEFEYEKQGQYFFLKAINNHNQSSNSKKHQFEYVFGKGFPNPLSIATDHWGGWNGKNDAIDVENYLENLTLSRFVNTYYADAGLLNKITYPTGGSTEFEYEHNRYNYYLEKEINTLSVQINTLTNSMDCAGARIKRIRDFDPVSGRYSNTRTFDYIDPIANKGSGTIGLKPHYENHEEIEYEVKGNVRCTHYIERVPVLGDSLVKVFNIEYESKVYFNLDTKSSSILGTEKNLGEYHIGYSDVIEYFEDGSYKHYSFSSFQDIPDNAEFNYEWESKEYLDLFYFSSMAVTDLSKMRKSSSDDWMSRFIFEDIPSSINMISLERRTGVRERAEKYGLFNLNDMSKFRGKLLSKISYSNDNKKVSEEINTYNINDAKSAYQFSIISNDVGASWNKIYTVPCLLIEQKIIDRNNVTSIIGYEYNNRSLLSKEKYYDSTNSLYETRYLYPIDYSSTIYTEMSNKNIISPIIEKAIYKDNNFLHKNIKDYYKHVVDSKDMFRVSKDKYKTGDGDEEVRVQYLNYDMYGNINYLIVDDAIKTVLIWSYKGQHLIAKIENADYNTVNQSLGGTSITQFSLSKSPDMSKIESLRTSLPEAMITTYRYDNLNTTKGIISLTDPRGFITYYEYDDFGRLNETYFIENGTRKVLQKHEYHFSNQE